jgi:integrase
MSLPLFLAEKEALGSAGSPQIVLGAVPGHLSHLLYESAFRVLHAKAKEFDWRFYVALVLANETGHRIGSIRKLRWSDIDLHGQTILWRAENEKAGYEHVTPMSSEAREALEYARSNNPGVGNAPIIPATKDPSMPMGQWVARDLWRKAERFVGLERKPGRGWHSLRRRFASELMHKPLKVVCDLGGWRDFETVLRCYQHPDEVELREALADRRRNAMGA